MPDKESGEESSGDSEGPIKQMIFEGGLFNNCTPKEATGVVEKSDEQKEDNESE